MGCLHHSQTHVLTLVPRPLPLHHAWAQAEHATLGLLTKLLPELPKASAVASGMAALEAPQQWKESRRNLISIYSYLILY